MDTAADQPVEIPPAIVIIGTTVLTLPLFFSRPGDRTLVAIVGLCVAVMIGLVFARQLRLRGGWWSVVPMINVVVWLVWQLTTSRLPSMGWLDLTALLATSSWGIMMTALAGCRTIWQRIGVLLLTTQTIAAGAGIISFLQHPKFRADGLFENPNALAGFLTWGVIAGTILFVSGWRRRWLVGPFLIILIGWALTVSLTAAVAVFLTAIVVAGIVSQRRARIRLGWALLIAVALLAAVQPMLEQRRLLTREHIVQSWEQRRTFIRDGLVLWQQRPWTGWGLGSFQIVSARVTQQVAEQPRYTHSQPVQVLAEGGLLLGLLWITMTIGVGWAIWRSWQRSTGSDRRWIGAIGAAWLGCTIHTWVDFSWYVLANQLWWWTIAGVAIGTARPQFALRGMTWKLSAGAAILLVTAGMWWLSAQASEAGDRAVIRNEYGDAITAYDRARRFVATRSDTIGSAHLRWVQRQGDDMATAETILLAAMKKNPEDYAYVFSLARIRVAQDRDVDALRLFQRAAQIAGPLHPDIIYEEARTLVRMERQPEARRLVRDILERYPDYENSPNQSAVPALRAIDQLRRELDS